MLFNYIKPLFTGNEMLYNLDVGENQNASLQTCTNQEYLQVQINFEESFPFKELAQLVEVISSANVIERKLLLPKALHVANKMKLKFSNSLSIDYEKWVIAINNAILKFHEYENEGLQLTK